MKLDRALKKYYRGNLQMASLPEITGLPGKTGVHKPSGISGLHTFLLNTTVHLILAILLVMGLFQYREETELSRCFTRYSEEKNILLMKETLPVRVQKALKSN